MTVTWSKFTLELCKIKKMVKENGSKKMWRCNIQVQFDTLDYNIRSQKHTIIDKKFKIQKLKIDKLNNIKKYFTKKIILEMIEHKFFWEV